MFRLSKEEYGALAEARCKKHEDTTADAGSGGRRYMPYVFTEQGVAMLSSVLRSERAVKVNIAIMRAFVEMRRWAQSYEELAQKIAEMEAKYDRSFTLVAEVLKKLTPGVEDDGRKIGFNK